MAPDKAINERDNLQAQVRFHRGLNFGFLILLVLVVLLLIFVVVRDTTKIVPNEIKRPYEMGANYANRDYLLDMAGYVLGTVLTVSPEVVDYNNKIILKMTDPDGYPALKTALDATAMRIKKDRITTVWMPTKEEVSEDAKRVKVSGRLKTYLADALTSVTDKEYQVEFISTISGRLYVSKIEEVVKRTAAH